MEVPTPLDQAAFLEAIGVDPNEVMRDTTRMEFEGDMVKVVWQGFKFVPVSKLMYALTEAEEEAARAAAARTAKTSTPRSTRKRDYDDDEAVEAR